MPRHSNSAVRSTRGRCAPMGQMPCRPPTPYLWQVCPRERASPDPDVKPLLRSALDPECLHTLPSGLPPGTGLLDTPFAFGATSFSSIIFAHHILQASRICVAVWPEADHQSSAPSLCRAPTRRGIIVHQSTLVPVHARSHARRRRCLDQSSATGKERLDRCPYISSNQRAQTRQVLSPFAQHLTLSPTTRPPHPWPGEILSDIDECD